jgi:AcrR family transcriptional regulator
VAQTTRRKGALRRDEILNAASTLFIRYGPSKTTTRQIADAVGISQPSLYAHFPTKEALLQALAARAFGLLEDRMAQKEPAPLNPSDHLSALIKGYIDFALEEPSAYKIAFMIDVDLSDEVFIATQEIVGLRAFAIFQSKIEDLQKQNFVKAGDSNLIAQSIWAAMHGLCALLLARPLFPWADRSTLIAAHTQLILQGARATT